MKTVSQVFAVFFFFFISIQLSAQCCSAAKTASCCNSESWDGHRPDSHAPIGVMGDHYHHKGGLMFSYRYMNMAMEGNLAGSEAVNNPFIFQNYMLAPQTMNMQMHMPGLMYAPSERLTFMLMSNYLFNEMDLVAMDGMNHHHENSGLGDTKLSSVLGIWKAGKQSIHLNASLSIPTGSITEAEPAQGEHGHGGHHLTQLPYPMQLGSGTWDVSFGGTYLGQTEKVSWGTQIIGTFRTGENSAAYRLGNQYQLTSWLAYRLNDWLSFSFRAAGISTEKMIGADAELMPMMAPTTNPINFGGEQVNGYAGFNLYIPSGIFEDLRLGLEFGMPLYQNVNGIQMKQELFVNTGIKYSLF